MRALRRGAPGGAPPDPATLVPVLRPGDWALAPACAHRGIMHPQLSAGYPLIAVAKPTDDGLDFVRWPALDELGMSWAELLRYATETLCARAVAWAELHQVPGASRPSLLGFDGDGVLSASRLLDADLMARAHETLGSRILLASVPSQRQLFVTDGSPIADRSVHRAFELWARRHHAAADGVDALSPRVFVVRGGTVVGVYESPA